MNKSYVESEHLVQAETRVAQAKLRVAEQEERVCRDQLAGLRRGTAEKLLQTMRVTLAAAEAHRDLILAALQKMKAGRSA